MESIDGLYCAKFNHEARPNSQWKIVVPEETIQKALTNLSGQITVDYQDKDLLLVGVLTGAVYFVVDLSRGIYTNHKLSFIRSSSYNNEQISSNTIELTGFSASELAELPNKHVLVVYQLYESGHTLDDVVSYLKQFNPLSIKTCVMFRKRRSTNYSLPDYCGIDNLPDVWYVGYGVDDCGSKRNYMNLYAVPKAPGVPPSSDDTIFDSTESLLTAMKEVLICKNPCRDLCN